MSPMSGYTVDITLLDKVITPPSDKQKSMHGKVAK